MNSRERVMTTLNHKEPDMVPIDLGGNQSGIHIKAYKNLINYLKIEDKNIRYSDFIQQLAYPCEELLKRLDVDIRWLRAPASLLPGDFTPQVEGKYQGVFDQFGVFRGDSADKDVKDILFYDPRIHPLSEAKTAQDIREYDWPDGTDRTPLTGLREHARKLGRRLISQLLHRRLGASMNTQLFSSGSRRLCGI